MAQKWVNMTFKYFWLFGIINSEDIEKLHAPLDSYIIHAISDVNKKNKYGFNFENGKYKNVKWSRNLTEEQYCTIQRLIKQGIKEKGIPSVIEWENMAWIEQAKIESDLD